MKYVNFEDSGDAIPDEVYMREALREAQKALEQDEVPIGAVVVAGGRIIGRGHNLTERLNDVTAHAEMQAFTAAASYLGGKYLRDSTLYVTIEPCVMCAGAAYWTQVGRIVFGARDEKRGFSKFGSQVLHPKTTLSHGVLEAECADLVTSFFRNKRTRR
ncbi:nucleoside deaminase [Parapedobacter sp. 10938]|uniref:nucleoside deaminase n=1 Tax=Parapedobacter flavus TaxID=3110225 RepID=UPI002DB9A702|nr:nucleoside deaminase [Parapedobacter sp. 10938]MEC3879431.1 nucleoside deaminase [Parapedobacter sp. 10938]